MIAQEKGEITVITFDPSTTAASSAEKTKKRAAQIQALRAMIRTDKDDFSRQVHTMALKKLEDMENDEH